MEELKTRKNEILEGEYIATIDEISNALQCGIMVLVYKYGEFINDRKTYVAYEINYQPRNNRYTLLCSNRCYPNQIGDYGGYCKTILDAEHCTIDDNGTIKMKNIYKTFLGTDEPFFSMGMATDAMYFSTYQFIIENFVQNNWQYYPIEIALGRQEDILLK